MAKYRIKRFSDKPRYHTLKGITMFGDDDLYDPISTTYRGANRLWKRDYADIQMMNSMQKKNNKKYVYYIDPNTKKEYWKKVDL